MICVIFSNAPSDHIRLFSGFSALLRVLCDPLFKRKNCTFLFIAKAACCIFAAHATNDEYSGTRRP